MSWVSTVDLRTQMDGIQREIDALRDVVRALSSALTHAIDPARDLTETMVEARAALGLATRVLDLPQQIAAGTSLRL